MTWHISNIFTYYRFRYITWLHVEFGLIYSPKSKDVGRISYILHTLQSIRYVTNNRNEVDIVKIQNLRLAQKLISLCGISNSFEISMRCRINGRNYYYWYYGCYRPISLGILNRFNHLSAVQQKFDDGIKILHWIENVFSVRIMLNSVMHTHNGPSFQTPFYIRVVWPLFDFLFLAHLDLLSPAKNEIGIVNFHFVANVGNIKKIGPFSWIRYGTFKHLQTKCVPLYGILMELPYTR